MSSSAGKKEALHVANAHRPERGWQQSTINATTNDYTGWTDELFHKDPINSTTNDYTGQTHELLHNDRGMYYPAFINAAPWLSGSIL